jgi:type II secretion system protein C
MGSILSWGANAVLFVVGCFLAADTANAILTSVLLSPPEQVGEAAPLPTLAQRSWEDRQVILTRNLFKSSTEAAPLVPVEMEEDIEATRLPLTLLGTAAAENPQLAWAAIEDREKHETLVVSVGDAVASRATVQRIERRRVVLLENGSPRELTLEADKDTTPTRSTARSRPSRTSRRSAARTRPRDRVEVPKREVQKALRNPASILSQARILPKWEDGEMQGVQLQAIKAGSLLEEVGFVNGDVITEVNGEIIDSPEQSAKFMRELSEADEIEATVDRDGQRVTIPFVINE